MRILVLGATGMLGHKLWQRLPARFPETFATLRTSRSSFAGCELFEGPRVIDRVDAIDFRAVERVLDDVRPDAVVNCIAVTKRREAADDALASIELNAALPLRLARWAAAHGSRVVHFSTDCVFDGRTGGYTEASPTTAGDLYGRTKALGEIDDAACVLTLRTSFIGRELRGGTELLEWFLAQRGGTVRGFRKAIYTGVSTVRMAAIVAELLGGHPGLHGLYQVASPPVSKFELLGLARDAYGVDVRIEPEDATIVRRDLDGARFRAATGIDVPDWRTMMRELAEDPTPYDRWSAFDAARG